jgi:nucleoside-diphosphate-sugar epimerase
VPVRLGIVYGLGPVVKTDYRFMTVPNKFSLQAVRGEALTVTAAGARPQGFIHVADAAKAMQFAAENEALTGYAPVNAGTELRSPRTIALAVKREAAKTGREVTVHTPEIDDFVEGSVGLVSRLTPLGFSGDHRLDTTIHEMLDYFATVSDSTTNTEVPS